MKTASEPAHIHATPIPYGGCFNTAWLGMMFGPFRIGFHMGRHIEKAPVVEIQTETGSMRVSTPETTAFDLVRFAPSAGHIGNVITVLNELVEKIDPQALTSLADLHAVSDVQRLGYLLERLGENRLADPLAVRLKARRYRPILLAPGQKKTMPRLTRGGVSYLTRPWRWNFDPPRACDGLAFSRPVADGRPGRPIQPLRLKVEINTREHFAVL